MKVTIVQKLASITDCTPGRSRGGSPVEAGGGQRPYIIETTHSYTLPM